MTPPAAALAGLWAGLGGPADALRRVQAGGNDPVWPSSFGVATAAQTSLAAAALAASCWAEVHGRPAPSVEVDRRQAALACSSRFRVDGVEPPMWDPLSGLHACGDAVGAPGRIRLHANFAHHRDRALELLGLPPGAATTRDAVAEALRRWPAEAFETALAEAGGVAAALRDAATWQRHPAARATADEPLVALRRTGDAPPRPPAAVPARAAAPLTGLRVLDLTRILAGPVAGRLLAEWGADVLMVNGPGRPNIAAVADLSRGKRSALLDLATEAGTGRLRCLAANGHVFLQAYRPGSLALRGFAPEALAAAAPGIVCVSLAAWGFGGPWAGRRGFDSLVQTATGLNVAEAIAGGDPAGARALPVQILDHAAGHLLAAGALRALARQALEGGSWEVRVSLAGVARWLTTLGQDGAGLAVPAPAIDEAWGPEEDSGFGRLQGLRPAVRFDGTEARAVRPSMPPGSHPAQWVTATA